jgi:LysR family transcriptional regulator for metE and metH
MNLQLETRHLKLIVAVTEAGTISRASEHLNLTQSALSHQLRDVEQKLGTQLFMRLKKRMVLTPAGEKLLASARKVLTELETIEADVRKLGARNGGGTLRVSTECYTCYHWLPLVMKSFREQFPNVSVQIIVEATRNPVEALLDGKIDLAIVSSQIDKSKVSVKPLFQDELLAIVHPNHPLASRPFLKAEDFTEENVFTYSVPITQNTFFQQILLPNNVMPKQVSPIELTEAIIEMVKANLGVAVLANWAIRPHVQPDTLRAVKVTKKGLQRQWSAATLRNQKKQAEPKYMAKFIELLAETQFDRKV